MHDEDRDKIIGIERVDSLSIMSRAREFQERELMQVCLLKHYE